LQASPPLVWVGLGLSGLVVGVAGLVVGFVIYGVATLQAGVLPRWCGVAFIAAPPVALVIAVQLVALGAGILSFFEVFFLGFFVVIGLPWLALGYALWGRREAQAEQQQQPRRVR
jgi:hypothetical protein